MAAQHRGRWICYMVVPIVGVFVGLLDRDDRARLRGSRAEMFTLRGVTAISAIAA
jgi:hypothetical protein